MLRTRTSLGRAVRAACRVVHHRRSSCRSYPATPCDGGCDPMCFQAATLRTAGGGAARVRGADRPAVPRDAAGCDRPTYRAATRGIVRRCHLKASRPCACTSLMHAHACTWMCMCVCMCMCMCMCMRLQPLPHVTTTSSTVVAALPLTVAGAPLRSRGRSCLARAAFALVGSPRSLSRP